MYMKENEAYLLEEYFEQKVTRSIINQINEFEFPDEWTPRQVIEYITYKIDRK
jgi:hypothetical protein